MQLLSLLTMSSILFTGVTHGLSTVNKKLCMTNSDPNKCSVTVVRNDKRPPPPAANGGGDMENLLMIFDNECNTIIANPDDCHADGGDNDNCQVTIPEGVDSYTADVEGMSTQVVIDGSGDGDDLSNAVPLFTVHWGKYTVNDHQDSRDSCTCAHSPHDQVVGEACSCWITCGDV